MPDEVEGYPERLLFSHVSPGQHRARIMNQLGKTGISIVDMEAGERQVPYAKVGLAQVPGAASHCAVTILTR